MIRVHPHIHPQFQHTQLECDRLGAPDCDAPEVNAAAVLLMKYVLALEVGWGFTVVHMCGGRPHKARRMHIIKPLFIIQINITIK